MAVDQKLLDILVCPNCHGAVEYSGTTDEIACQGECGYRYPVRDGIPVMLIDEAIKPGARDA
jgi:uncharacterized protein